MKTTRPIQSTLAQAYQGAFQGAQAFLPGFIDALPEDPQSANSGTGRSG